MAGQVNIKHKKLSNNCLFHFSPPKISSCACSSFYVVYSKLDANVYQWQDFGLSRSVMSDLRGIEGISALCLGRNFSF
jgi:hypothetical protein